MTLVAALILIASAWPFAALWAQGPFRRTFPRLASYVLVGMAGYLITVAALATFTPRLAQLLAVVAAVAVIAQTWRARPSFGCRRNLPPGELRLLPVGAWLDPAFYTTQAQRYGPVFKSSHFMQPMVCVVGLETGFEVLRKYEDDEVVPPEAAFARYIPCSYIRSMSPENHRKYRPILQAAVSSEVNDVRAADVHAVLARHLDRMVIDGQDGDRGRHLAPYAVEALYEALFQLFFGVEPGTAPQRSLRDTYRVLDASHRRRATVWAPPEQTIRDALQATLRLLERRIETFAQRPEPPGSYLEAAWRHGGLEAIDEVVQLNLIYLLQVTCTDLVGLFDWILKKLSDHPDWQARLRTAIDEHGFASEEATALGRRIVSETFRLEQSEHIYRKIVKPITVGGFDVPRGWLLRICVRESHHCSPAFEEPEAFNPDRFLNRTYGPFEYAPFGMFRRRCIGVDTGLALGGMLARAIVGGYQWQVTNPGTPEFRGWHWTPGSAFAVRLSRRQR